MMIMLWLYTCMYQLFLGAELNNLLHPESISGDTAEDILNIRAFIGTRLQVPLMLHSRVLTLFYVDTLEKYVRISL